MGMQHRRGILGGRPSNPFSSATSAGPRITYSDPRYSSPVSPGGGAGALGGSWHHHYHQRVQKRCFAVSPAGIAVMCLFASYIAYTSYWSPAASRANTTLSAGSSFNQLRNIQEKNRAEQQNIKQQPVERKEQQNVILDDQKDSSKSEIHKALRITKKAKESVAAAVVSQQKDKDNNKSADLKLVKGDLEHHDEIDDHAAQVVHDVSHHDQPPPQTQQHQDGDGDAAAAGGGSSNRGNIPGSRDSNDGDVFGIQDLHNEHGEHDPDENDRHDEFGHQLPPPTSDDTDGNNDHKEPSIGIHSDDGDQHPNNDAQHHEDEHEEIPKEPSVGIHSDDGDQNQDDEEDQHEHEPEHDHDHELPAIDEDLKHQLPPGMDHDGDGHDELEPAGADAAADNIHGVKEGSQGNANDVVGDGKILAIDQDAKQNLRGPSFFESKHKRPGQGPKDDVALCGSQDGEKVGCGGDQDEAGAEQRQQNDKEINDRLGLPKDPLDPHAPSNDHPQQQADTTIHDEKDHLQNIVDRVSVPHGHGMNTSLSSPLMTTSNHTVNGTSSHDLQVMTTLINATAAWNSSSNLFSFGSRVNTTSLHLGVNSSSTADGKLTTTNNSIGNIIAGGNNMSSSVHINGTTVSIATDNATNTKLSGGSNMTVSQQFQNHTLNTTNMMVEDTSRIRRLRRRLSSLWHAWI